MNKEKCRLGISVIYLSDMSGNIELQPNTLYTLLITYPLNSGVEFLIHSGDNGCGLISLLSDIGKAYEKVYASPEQFGIWGHDIGDLVLESISVDHDKRLITLSVGS